MRIRVRIISGYLLLVLAVVGIVYFVHVGMTRILHEASSVESEILPTYMFLRRLKEDGLRLVSSTNEALFIQETVIAGRGEGRHAAEAEKGEDDPERMLAEEGHSIEVAKGRISRNLDAYRAFILREAPHETELMERIETAGSQLLASSSEILRAQRNGAAAAELLDLKERYEKIEWRFLNAVEKGLEFETDEFREGAHEVKEAITAAAWEMRLGSAAVFLVALLGGGLIARSLALPLEHLKKKIETFGRHGEWGDLPLNRQDEIGDLARAFNAMAVDLQRNQRALEEMRDYADSILGVMSNALAVVGPDGAIERVNRSLCALLQRQESELIGRPLAGVISPEAEAVRKGFDQRPLSLELAPLELHLVDGQGQEVPVIFSAAPLHGAGGQLLGSVCVAQDISDRKRAEEQVLAGKLFLESVLNSMEDEVVIIHPDKGLVVDANRAFLSRLQTHRDEVLGRPAYDLIHNCSAICPRPAGECPLSRVLETRRAASCEHVVQGENGPERFMEIQICPILDLAGERVTEVVHVARDVTKQRQTARILEEFAGELEANNRLLVAQTAELEAAHTELKASQSRILQQEKMASIGQLAAGVAHEINNPMGFIISNLNTLGKYTARLMEYLEAQEQGLCAAAPPEQREELAALRRRLKVDRIVDDLSALLGESLEGADRVKKIVQDLRSFSRLDQLECSETDLNECLESTLGIVWNELKYKVTLKKDYAADLPRIPCFAQQLNQVFLNLLVNAGQAIKGEGKIEIRTWSEPDWVCVAIADSGCGIPQEVQNRIFEPFFTTKAVGEGTGLGLSISYDIIKKHQGRIDLQSTPGQGTTFTIRLPLHPAGPSAGGGADSPSATI